MSRKILSFFSLNFLFLLLTGTVLAASSSEVGVEIGETLTYHFNRTTYILEQNGESFTKEVSVNFEGKNATITVESIKEISDKVQINSSIHIGGETYPHSTYLNQWYDFLFELYSAFFSQFINFDPETFNFETYNVTNKMVRDLFLEFPIYSTTDYDYYLRLYNNMNISGESSISKKSHFYRFNHSSGLFYDTPGDYWSIDAAFYYYVYVDIKVGLVNNLNFLYGFDFKVNSSQTKFYIGYDITRVQDTKEIEFTPFSLSTIFISVSVLTIVKKVLRRRR